MSLIADLLISSAHGGNEKLCFLLYHTCSASGTVETGWGTDEVLMIRCCWSMIKP